jgi:hypothetical protein
MQTLHGEISNIRWRIVFSDSGDFNQLLIHLTIQAYPYAYLHGSRRLMHVTNSARCRLLNLSSSPLLRTYNVYEIFIHNKIPGIYYNTGTGLRNPRAADHDQCMKRRVQSGITWPVMHGWRILLALHDCSMGPWTWELTANCTFGKLYIEFLRAVMRERSLEGRPESQNASLT